MEKEQVLAIDLDSAYNRGGFVQPTLNINNNILSYLPYEEKYNIKYLMATPNHNTMYACFIYMLINSLLSTKISSFTPSKLDSILDYFTKKGLAKEVIKAMSTIFTPRDNYFYSEFLDLIDPEINYQLKRK